MVHPESKASTLLNIVGDYDGLLKDINAGLEKARINLDEFWGIDCLTYRVSTNERYEKVQQQFGEIAAIRALNFPESETPDQPHELYRLRTAIRSEGWTVSFLKLKLKPLELDDNSEGFDHAEFYVVGGLDAFK